MAPSRASRTVQMLVLGQWLVGVAKVSPATSLTHVARARHSDGSGRPPRTAGQARNGDPLAFESLLAPGVQSTEFSQLDQAALE